MNILLFFQFVVEAVEVPLQESIQFSCKKTVSSSPLLFWAVTLPNNVFFSTIDPTDSRELQRKGIVTQTSGSYSNLTILASLENNGTTLVCREVMVASQVDSMSINLVVIGEL